MRPGREHLIVAVGLAYLAVTGWAMTNLTYDVWGALIVAPVIIAVSMPLLRRAFGGAHRHLLVITQLGLVAKLLGCLVRYWVAFDAYGGASDAEAYHKFGRVLAQQIRSGEATLWAAVPKATGTAFIETLTGDVYTVFGSSKLAGFLLFGWMGYAGALCYLRAAMISVPGLATRRYAVLLCLLPSLVYWPSSIGKEAWMMLCLGLASLGGAKLLSSRINLRGISLVFLGLLGAGFVRPHFGAIWIGSLIVAIAVGVATARRSGRRQNKVAAVLLLAVATLGLAALAIVTLRYLDPSNDDDAAAPVTDRITAIFETTENRTGEGGSSFDVISIESPKDVPYAVFKTLTRPLLTEARSFAELLPAVEMTGLLLLAAIGWRRWRSLPRSLVDSPYVVFAVVASIMWAIAFTNIGNLGILTRQRSLILPLLSLIWCLPSWRRSPRDRPGRRDVAAPRPLPAAAPSPQHVRAGG